MNVTALSGGSDGEASRGGEPGAPSYVYVHPGSHARISRTVEVADGILVDVDVNGQAIGVERLGGPEMTATEVERWAAAGERAATVEV